MTSPVVYKCNDGTVFSGGIGMDNSLQAKSILFSLIPNSWVLKESVKDKVDLYQFEITSFGKPSGITFGVHIKSTNSPKFSDEYIYTSVDTDLLSHFNANFKIPVIMALVDNSKQNIYWLFVQDYIQNVLEKTNQDWHSKKTVRVKIPLTNKLTGCCDQLQEEIIDGSKYLYLRQFHWPYWEITESVQLFLSSSEELISAIQKEQARLRESIQSGANFETKCNPYELTVQETLNKAQMLKLMEPTENRRAYYSLHNALNQAGSSISPGLRYTVIGEMAFYDYVYNFLLSFDSVESKSKCISTFPEGQRFFDYLDELTEIINSSLEEGELLAASMLTIRLADCYLVSIPYINTAFGQDKASPLLEFAQSLLILSHEMASYVESPNSVIM